MKARGSVFLFPSNWLFNKSVKKHMSAIRWTINGRAVTEAEARQIQREAQARAATEKAALTAANKTKTPSPPRFAQPAHRAPSMRVSSR